MSIWTDETSRYGTYPADVKPVSKTTVYRWNKENRSKTRQAQAMKKVA